MSDQRASVPGLALMALAVLVAGAILVVTAGASTPSTSSVSLDTRTTAWKGEVYALGQTKAPDACLLPGNTVCDHFELNVDIDPTHWDTATGGVEVKIIWPDESDDFDLFVYDEAGNQVGSSANGGTSSERVFIKDASGTYRVEVAPWGVTDSGYDGGAYVETREDVGQTGGEVPAEPLSGQACENGAAGPFPCKGIDLESFMPRSTIGDGELNDIWGWADPQTGREYALVGKTSGTAFVDVTDARAPVYLGDLPSHQPVETIFNTWRDIKVYKDHAYIVSEEPLHGMQVFDLTRLRGVTEPQTWSEDAHYSYTLDGIQSHLEQSTERTPLNPPDNAHNIAINEESGYAYAIGTSTCGGGGSHMIDIRDPKNPKFAGCVSEDGYTHDNQCVNYRASDPDPAFAGREICFDSNEDTLTIVDVTDKANPEQLARIPYDGATYTHQGWLTEDRKHFLVDDELDEQDQGGQTKTYVFNVERLRSPKYVSTYNGKAGSIDHNQYIEGNRSYQSNYRSGLRVLDVSDVASGTLTESGFFDVYPEDDEAEFNGTWSNYPYLPSGNVIVSGIEQGLFVLRPHEDVAGSAGLGTAKQTPSAARETAAAGGGGSQATADKTAPRARIARVPRRMKLRTFLKGVRPRVRSSEAVSLRFELLGRGKTLARKSLGMGNGTRSVKLKPNRRRVGKPRAFIARVKVTAIDAAGNPRVVIKRFRVTR
jgi:choice-of-anchor B domain-containing protein